MSIAFCSFAFGYGYCQTQIRLKASISNVYPDAAFFFYNDRRQNQIGDASLGDEPGVESKVGWENNFPFTGPPPGCRPFHQSIYGFKPHLVQAALDAGHKKIVLLDPSMILLGKLDKFQSLASERGVLAFEDCLLNGAISNKCLQYFGVSRESLGEKRLVGGSFYYFDFDTALCRTIFDEWKSAEAAGIYGSQHELSFAGLQGHRADEAVMSMLLYKHGQSPLPGESLKLLQEPEPAFQKKHHYKY
jgi:hypothetical protein